MQNIYSHDEIVAFVDSHLKRMGTGAMNDRKIASDVVGWISQLPPLFQVLTIASRHDLVFADPGVMNRLFKEADTSFRGNVRGFYSSSEKKFDNFSLNHPIFFYRRPRGGINAATASHEKTHDFDQMLGERSFKKKNVRFYSSISKEWEDALERQIERFCSDTKFANEDPAELLRWGREELSGVFAAQSKGKSLYDDYRPLLDHLSLYDTKEKRLAEAQAEMGAHYAMLYAQTGGDECAIDMKLTARYPELWEEFRDNVLPQYEEMAREFLAGRDVAIEDYVARASRMADMYGLDAREDDFIREAALAHAGGRMDELMEDLDMLSRFYRNPVDNYAAAVRSRDDLYFENGDINLPAADDAYQRGIAMNMLQTYGLAMLGDAYLDIEHEMESFKKYLSEYDRIMNAYEDGEYVQKFFSALYPARSAASAFRELYENGGGRAVDEHLSRMPSCGQVMAFTEAAAELVSLRDKIVGKSAEPVSPENLERAIITGLQEIFESRRYNEIERRRSILADDIFSLRSYNNEVNRLAAIASLYTGAQGQKPSGQEILERYDEIKTARGIEGVDEATENLLITGEDIKEYVSLRKDYDDWLRSIYEHGAASVPFVEVENDVVLAGPERRHSADLLAKIADEIMEMGFGGGAKEMDERKETLRGQIVALKSYTTGLDVIVTEGPETGRTIAPKVLRSAVVGTLLKLEP
ncbi:MAG TPA: hypothetical protein VFS88_00770 [Micavibrio sp.]|nr:hypothetical protein [Micavibrio sp.]